MVPTINNHLGRRAVLLARAIGHQASVWARVGGAQIGQPEEGVIGHSVNVELPLAGRRGATEPCTGLQWAAIRIATSSSN